MVRPHDLPNGYRMFRQREKQRARDERTASLGVRFTLRARDPSGEFLEVEWSAPVYPAVGDEVMLPDGDSSTGQELTVDERVFRLDGGVDIWLGGYDGWSPGSVKDLFDLARSALTERMSA